MIVFMAKNFLKKSIKCCENKIREYSSEKLSHEYVDKKSYFFNF